MNKSWTPKKIFSTTVFKLSAKTGNFIANQPLKGQILLLLNHIFSGKLS